jgi:hypothetical protein
MTEEKEEGNCDDMRTMAERGRSGVEEEHDSNDGKQ